METGFPRGDLICLLIPCDDAPTTKYDILDSTTTLKNMHAVTAENYPVLKRTTAGEKEAS